MSVWRMVICLCSLLAAVGCSSSETKVADAAGVDGPAGADVGVGKETSAPDAARPDTAGADGSVADGPAVDGPAVDGPAVDAASVDSSADAGPKDELLTLGQPSVCDPAGWCWESPLPSGVSYSAVWGTGPKNI